MLYNYLPLNYEEPLFRPPSEADSIILQITSGCSWNKCVFCEMYTSKKFKIKPQEVVLKEITNLSKYNFEHRKLFLADGNPMVLSAEKLLEILNSIKQNLPRIRRVTTYSTPRDILSKSNEELRSLQKAGLSMLYIGIESGDDEVLKMVNKSETYNSTLEGLLKAKEAGIKLSVIILNGLGGLKYSKQHAVNSAKILNEIQPEFASSLILSFPYGENHYKTKFNGDYQSMSNIELLEEMEIFISHTNLQSTIYRSNHASNYISLSGVLSKDKEMFLRQLQFAINNPEIAGLRKEWQRGL